MTDPSNKQIATLLDDIADLLDIQDANPFRIRAYRDGANTVRELDRSAAEMVRKEPFSALTDLPAIGDGIAGVIGEYVRTGQSSLLQDLQTQGGPEGVMVQVPGIGKELASRIVEQAQVETLPDLEAAAYDGRLDAVEGFGPRRVAAVRTALAGMLSTSAKASQRARTRSDAADNGHDSRPSVAALLEIDATYRQKAAAGDLQTIAPRRFNPGDVAWLPVMHTRREGWTFTALYSNTARAHELDKTDDWVVIYYERDGYERQKTVVTETQGPLTGKRVVRGRAEETRDYYGEKAG